MSRPQTLSAVAVAVTEASSAIASDTSCTARPARSEASPRKRRGKFRRLAYTADYKKAAVARVLEGGETIPAVAKDLGISHQTLRNWITVVRSGEELRPTNPSIDETEMTIRQKDAEIRRLKHEIALLKKFREYLMAGG